MDATALLALLLGSASAAAILPFVGYGVAALVTFLAAFVGLDLLSPDDLPEPWIPESAVSAPYVAPVRPSIVLPSAPCRVKVARREPRAYPLPILRAPRDAAGRFDTVRYSHATR